MNLSSRAQTYLGTLRRRSPIPVERVASALKNARCPAFDPWLDFHSRFAGYEETIGVELAVWGIVHADPHWLVSEEACAEIHGEEGWHVVCADVHPSYDYWLDCNGQFVSIGGGGTYESFDKKVERAAMFWAATLGDRAW